MDVSREPRPGRMVSAAMNGELFIRRLVSKERGRFLNVDDPECRDIRITPEANLQIRGVVTAAIHLLLPGRRFPLAVQDALVDLQKYLVPHAGFQPCRLYCPANPMAELEEMIFAQRPKAQDKMAQLINLVLHHCHTQ